MTIFVSFAAGLIFGFGLLVSGMSDPAKVLAFLDVSGTWDPSLAFVMAGAIALSAVAFGLARRRNKPLFADAMQIPPPGPVNRRLIVGSALFGVGWGLAGICPGPALVVLGTGSLKGLLFVLAMLAGMALFEIGSRR